MTPGQVWWLIEDMMPPEILSRESDRVELYDMLQAAKAKYANRKEAE